MAILTAHEIRKQVNGKHIRIGNFDENRIQPNSYDVTLGNKISFYELNGDKVPVIQQNHSLPFTLYGMRAITDVNLRTPSSHTIQYNLPYLDTKSENPMITKEISDNGYILLPNILYLVETVESVWSDKYVTEVSGTSSLARLGITVHKTAGYSNIGHEFKWILEVEVTHPVKIYPGMKIGQMYFHTTEGKSNVQYNGKYKDEQMSDILCGSLNHIE